MKSCLDLKDSLYAANIAHDWNIGWNESLVHRARMEMTATFFEARCRLLADEKFTHMMWLDSDIEFTPDDVAKVWNLDADVGVGVYPMKLPDKQWYAAWKDGALVKDLDQFNGPTEVDYAGTGFMMIRREVLEKLTEIHGTYGGPNGRVPAIYMTPIFNDGLESEDFHFSRIARQAGFKVVMDPSVRLIHWGMYPFGYAEKAKADGH